jgi:hypothetical protein
MGMHVGVSTNGGQPGQPGWHATPASLEHAPGNVEC